MLEALLRRAVAMPVIALDDAHDAVPLAQCLADAGLTLREITLRTSAALPAVQAIRDAGIVIGVAIGTIRTPADMRAAQAAGAVALISPGTTPALIEAARLATVPWLPGVATASEVMALADAGYRVQKLFPSRIDLVDAFAGPFKDVLLVPTGQRPRLSAAAECAGSIRFVDHSATADHRARLGRDRSPRPERSGAGDPSVTIGYARHSSITDAVTCRPP
jgi:2-dehydro-3-deoxyphosphogluconate aldolase / (4S)-4-hydroxy-2-oxoglutarate aldolase